MQCNEVLTPSKMNAPHQSPAEKIKKMEAKIRIHFEKEIKIKKKILEMEKENQHFNFRLFQCQLDLAQHKEDSDLVRKIKKDAISIKKSIEDNNSKTRAFFISLIEQ